MNDTSHRILMVDDDVNVLDGFRRTLARRYALTVAQGGRAALDILRTGGPFAVVVTDMQMPEMNGVEFLEQARAVSRNSVYMMLTGNADQQTAVDAVNRGKIFRFLNKPCPPEQLVGALVAAIAQYDLLTAERVLLRDTLTGTIKVLTEALTLTDPEAAAWMTGVVRNMAALTEAIGAPNEWRFSMAARLSLVGLVALRDTDDGDPLGEDSLRDCAACGAKLLRHIPRIQSAINIVSRQREAGPLPSPIDPHHPESGETLGARLLRLSVDIERAAHGRIELDDLLKELDADPSPAAKTLGGVCRKLLSESAASVTPRARTRREMVMVSGLRPGMRVEADVLSKSGDRRLFLAKGAELNDVTIERLRKLSRTMQIESRVEVSWVEEDAASAAA